MLLNLCQLLVNGFAEDASSFIETGIGSALAAEVSVASGKRQRDKLHWLSRPVGKLEEVGTSVQIESSGRCQLTDLRLMRYDQLKRMFQSTAKYVAIMIAGDRQDGAAIAEELAKGFHQMPHRIPKRFRACEIAKQIASDQEHLDRFLLAKVGYLFDRFL